MRCVVVISALILIFLSMPAQGLSAEDQAGPQLLVLIMNLAQDESSSFHEFLVNKVLQEVQRAGFQGATVEQLMDRDSELMIDPTDAVAVSRAARSISATLAITGAYQIEEDQITITLRAFDAFEAEQLSEISHQAPIDLALDGIISEDMAEILGVLREHLSFYPADDSALGITEGQNDGQTQTPSGAFQVEKEGETVVTPGQPAGASIPRGESLRGGALALTVGLRPFLAVGRFGAFVNTGVGPLLALDYELGPRVAMGLLTGATGFLARGPLTDVLGLLVPMGLGLRYQRDLEPPYGIYFRVGCGPALFIINTDNTGTLKKLVPFATLGLGLTRMFHEKTGVSFDVAYEAYLESGELLMGFVPSVTLLKRL